MRADPDGLLPLAAYFYVFTVCKSTCLPVSIKGNHLLIPLFHTGPESLELPRIDKYLDSCLNRTQFVKILTDLHCP